MKPLWEDSGGGRDDSIRVRFNDGAIYARPEAKVVRINDEAPHSGSLAERTSWSCCGVVVFSCLYDRYE